MIPVHWPDTPAEDACLVLDFDGTLSPIVDDPSAAVLPSETETVLEELTETLGCVAIISGRPASFLAERICIPGLQVYGLYGDERVVGTEIEVLGDVGGVQIEVVKAALRETIEAWPGTELEDKTRSVAVHWRRAEDLPGAETALRRVVRGTVEDNAGLEILEGKMVLEVRPKSNIDKGTTFRRISTGYGSVCYCGDDLGDVPALQAAVDLGGTAVAIGTDAMLDPRVRDAATVVLADPTVLRAWLTDIVDRCRR